MSLTGTVRSVVSHRGVSCLELHRQLGELRRKVRQLTPQAERATAMEGRIDEQALTIDSLREQLDTAKAIRDDIQIKAGRYREAEAKAQEADRQLAEQTKELIALRQFRNNVNSVSSLPPHPAPVAPTADRFESGSPLRLGASRLVTTDPDHVPPPLSNDDTVPVPVVAAEPAEGVA